jgi:hypothetical protein
MATSGNTTLAVEREPNPGIIIGPRAKAELERRIHELENRFKPTHSELRELASLKELLKGTGGER